MQEKYKYHFLPGLFLRAPVMSTFSFDIADLQAHLRSKVFQNALYLASPGFYSLISAKEFEFGQLNARERHTLLKYYNRMCFRPTPFGAFATFTLLHWEAGRGQIELAGDEEIILHLLPSQALVSGASAVPLKLTLNPLLYLVGEEYRFIRSVYDEKGKCRYSIETLGTDPFYDRLLTFLKNKTLTIATLSAWIMRQTSCSKAEAYGQAEFLVDEQVLLSPVQRSPVSSPDIRGSGNARFAFAFTKFWKKHRSSALSTKMPLKALEEMVRKKASGGPPAVKETFYGAAQRPYKAGSLSETDRAELETAIHILQRLALPIRPAALKEFTEAFKARFDLKEVPLLEAVDPDCGISYGGLASGHFFGDELLADVAFPPTAVGAKLVEWTPVHQLLFGLWKDAEKMNGQIELAQEELNGKDLPSAELVFPQTTAITFRKTEDHLLIEYAGGASATGLAGRFSVFSEEVKALCRQLAQEEVLAAPGVVFADIGQLSDIHVDNINRRDAIYPFEIPLNVFSNQPVANQLRPGDLVLFMQGEELVLYSRRLQTRVVPRLATAYNYRNNELAIFRLLCDLQHQGTGTTMTLDLEALFPGMEHYPRVTAGRVVLCCAKWVLYESAFSIAANANNDDKLAFIRQLRIAKGLPQKIALGEFDQQLVFDLGQDDEALFFLDCAAGLKRLTIREYLGAGRSVKAGMLPFAGQFVGFLNHKAVVYHPVEATNQGCPANFSRDFLPGEDWLYLKVYCTPVSADQILAEVIAPVIVQFRQQVKNWFFIRYNDSGYHIRLRVQIAPAAAGEFLQAISSQLKANKLEHLAKELRTETYRREVERYGQKLIGHAERIFGAGSQLILKTLTDGRGSGFVEFRLAMITTYHLMKLFFANDEQIIGFCQQMSESFLREFGADKATKASLDKKYRSMGLQNDGIQSYRIPGEIAEEITFIGTELLKVKEVQRNQELQKRFLSHIVHMQLNRTFRTNQRKQEMLTYYFLFKHLRSLNSRAKKTQV